MSDKPTISLPVTQARVPLNQIPRLLAHALQPKIRAGEPKEVTVLKKEAVDPRLSDQWCGRGIDPFPVSLTDADWTFLAALWREAGLPDIAVPLQLPIPLPTLKPYLDAFDERGPVDQWRLWGMSQTPEVHDFVLRHQHQKDWKEEVRKAVVERRLIASDASLIPRPGYWPMDDESWTVSDEDFTQFAQPYGFSVRREIPPNAYAEQEEWKRARGRLTLQEAASAVAASGEARLEEILPKMERGAWSGDIPMFEPGRAARYEYGASAGQHREVRDFYEEAYPDDLNRWLEKFEPRVTYRFPVAPARPMPRSADEIINARLKGELPGESDSGDGEIDPPTEAEDEIEGAPDGRMLTSNQWRYFARKDGTAIRDRDAARNLYPSLSLIGDEIARDWRKRSITGPKGKPLSGSTIAREALKGLTLGAPAFNPMRGKRGERGERGER